MESWPALILSPLLVLIDQGTGYALIEWSCAGQQRLLPHPVQLAFFIVMAAMTLFTWCDGRPLRFGRGRDAVLDDRASLTLVAMLTGALSALVIGALWIPQWIVAHCN